MADNNSQSADSVMVEEGININRQQSNMDTQVAKLNDGIGDINGLNNDRKTFDPDTNQTYTEIGSCEETLQNQMELEGAEFWGKLKSQESCQQNSPIARVIMKYGKRRMRCGRVRRASPVDFFRLSEVCPTPYLITGSKLLFRMVARMKAALPMHQRQT
ncbi:uncharacterized protein [Ptychodera flava]|uniref:uncharacterized protein isoform X4 n=1 Tax=Ptychodera flava TaxID=63121 RepID=UPI00396A273D